MGRVRFAASTHDLEGAGGAGGDVLAGPAGAAVRSLRCVYETDAEVVQAIVPRPLDPALHPEVCLEFAELVRTGPCGAPSTLTIVRFGVAVEYDDGPGVHPLRIGVDAGEATEGIVAALRERFGEPGRSTRVELQMGSVDGLSIGDGVAAHALRSDVRFAALTGRVVESLAAREERESSYCVKAFPACGEPEGFDQDPLLVRLETRIRWRERWRLEGGVELAESRWDPVADLPVRRIARLEAGAGEMVRAARVLRPVPAEWLRAFGPARYDAPGIEGVEV